MLTNIYSLLIFLNGPKETPMVPNNSHFMYVVAVSLVLHKVSRQVSTSNLSPLHSFTCLIDTHSFRGMLNKIRIYKICGTSMTRARKY